MVSIIISKIVEQLFKLKMGTNKVY